MPSEIIYYQANINNILSTGQARMQRWIDFASNAYVTPTDAWSLTIAAGGGIQSMLDRTGTASFMTADAPTAYPVGNSGYWSASVGVPAGTTNGQVTLTCYVIEGDTTSTNYGKYIAFTSSSTVVSGRVGTTVNVTASPGWIKQAKFVLVVKVAAGAGSKKITAASINQGNGIYQAFSPTAVIADFPDRFDTRLVIMLSDGSKRMMPLADNIQFSSPLSDAGALSFDHPKDGDVSVLLDRSYLEVAAEISYDGGFSWHEYPNCRFYRSGFNTEDTALNGMVSVTMSCISNILQNMAIVDLSPLLIDASGNRPFHAATVGAIFVRLFADNHNIGVGTAIDFTGSNTLDSNGKAWSNTLEVSFAPGTTLRSMLDSFVGLGVCEWVMIGRHLYIYDPSSDKNSTGLWACDRTAVILQRAVDIETSSSSKSDAGLITKALAIGNAGTNYVRTSAAAPSPWGHLLGVQMEANADSVTLQKITSIMLSNGAGVQNQQTVNLVLAQTPHLPFANYKIGDYVYPDIFDDQLPSQSRVVQFSVAKSGQVVTASAVLNNRYIQSLILLARKQAGLVNSSVVPKNSKLATLVPKAPVSVSCSANTFIVDDVVRCTVDITWTEVAAATDGTALDITGFDIYGHQVTGTGATTTDRLYSQVGGGQHVLTLTNLLPGCQYTFKVRQTAYGTQAGTFSGYVNITTPFPSNAPSTPSIPALSSRNGATQVVWDGKDSAGLAMPPEFKNIKVQRADNAAFTGTVTDVGIMPWAGTTHVLNVTNLTYGQTYYFRFIAYTTDNRNSLPSAVASIMVGQATSSDIAAGAVTITHVDGTITTPINNANTTATTANNTANTANNTANTANSTANTAKTTADTAKSTADAANTAAGAAQTTANSAVSLADGANTKATDAVTIANGKNKITYAASAPTTGRTTGDIWFNTTDGNHQYVWSGTAWSDAQDAAIPVSLANSNTAITTANGKNKTFYQTTAPTGGMVTNDLWFDTANGNKPYTYNGSAWVSVQDASIATAQTTANTANTNASTALTAANGKNKITYSVSAAFGVGTVVGDLWLQTSAGGGTVIGQWQWNGTVWVSQTITNSVIANLDAGKVTTGYLDAARIAARSISATQLTLGSTDNLVDNPQFLGGFTSWTASGGTSTIDPTGARNGGPAMKFVRPLNTSSLLSTPVIPALPAQFYKFTYWVKSSIALNAGDVAAQFVPKLASGGTGTRQAYSAPAMAANTWTQVSVTQSSTQGTTPATTVGFILELWVQGSVPSNTVWFDQVVINLVHDGTLIVDGAITAVKIQAGTITANEMKAGTITAASGIISTIDAGTITVGTLNSSVIAANSITTTHLSLMSVANVIDNPQFVSGMQGWAVTGTGVTGVITPTGAARSNNAPALVITTPGMVSNALLSAASAPFSVQGGQVYKSSFWIKSSVALPANAFIWALTVTSAPLSVSSNWFGTGSPAIAANTWTQVSNLNQLPLTANAIKASFFINFANTPATTLTIDQVVVNLATDASLIVDGSIDGKTITGATIRTAAPVAPYTRIEMTSSGIREYDNTNAVVSSWIPGAFTIVGGQITGGVFRTAASGPRVEIRDNLFNDVNGYYRGIRFYDSSSNYGVPAIAADTTDGDLRLVSGQVLSTSKWAELSLSTIGDWKLTHTGANTIQSIGTSLQIVAGVTAAPSSSATMTLYSDNGINIQNGALASVYFDTIAGRLRFNGSDMMIWTGSGSYYYGELNFREMNLPTTVWKLAAANSTTARLTTATTSVGYEIYLGSTNKMLGLDFSNGWQFYNTGGDRAFQVHSTGQYNYGPLYFREVGASVAIVTIAPSSAANGRITFGTGVTGEIYTGATDRRMAFSDSANASYFYGRLYARPLGGSGVGAYIESPSGTHLKISGPDLTIDTSSSTSIINWTNMTSTTSGSANMRYIGVSDGRIYLFSSWGKDKLDQQPIDTNYRLLDIPAKTWVDRGFFEEHHGLWDYRSVGAVLEDVIGMNSDANGALEVLIDRATDGRIQGLNYDRLAWMLLPTLKDMADRITALEEQLSKN